MNARSIVLLVRQRAQRVGAGRDPQLDAVGDAGVVPVPSRRSRSTPRSRRSTAAGRRRAEARGDAQRRVAGERADLDRRLARRRSRVSSVRNAPCSGAICIPATAPSAAVSSISASCTASGGVPCSTRYSWISGVRRNDLGAAMPPPYESATSSWYSSSTFTDQTSLCGAEDVVDREDRRASSSGPGCCTVHAVAPDRHTRSAAFAAIQSRSDLDVVLVVLVVDRVRLRHPHDVAGLDLARVGEAELLRAHACPARRGPRRTSSTCRRPRSRRTRGRGRCAPPSPGTATTSRSSGCARPSPPGSWM